MDQPNADALYQQGVAAATAAFSLMEKGKKDAYETELRNALDFSKRSLELLLQKSEQPLKAIVCKFGATMAYQLGLVEDAKQLAIHGIAGNDVPMVIGNELRQMLRSLTHEPWPNPELVLGDEAKAPVKKRTKKAKT